MADFVIITEISEAPRVVIVRTRGYIDDEGGEKIRKIVQSFIDKGETRFLFNFAESPIINSTGICYLLELAEEITFHLQGRIAFSNLSKAISEVFNMMGITTTYPVCPDEAAAMAEVGK